MTKTTKYILWGVLGYLGYKYIFGGKPLLRTPTKRGVVPPIDQRSRMSISQNTIKYDPETLL